MSAAIKLENVVKRFGVIEVLKGLTLDITPGEVVALIGASGSGKSTALRCINRLEEIQGGRIEVCGREVSDDRIDLRALRQDVGMVFGSVAQIP